MFYLLKKMIGLTFPSWGFAVGGLTITAAVLLFWQGRYMDFAEHTIAAAEGQKQ
jgi:Ni/Fe-hydrogenase subunit HybB-like protein